MPEQALDGIPLGSGGRQTFHVHVMKATTVLLIENSIIRRCAHFMVVVFAHISQSS